MLFSKALSARQENMQQDYFKEKGIDHVDYKNVEILKKFINPHARINNRRRTGLTAKNQRRVAEAIKRARYMALLPYIMR